jgi:hypothetical protein
MAAPKNFKLTPKGTTTQAIGVSADASGEVWRRISAGATPLHIIHLNVPYDVAQAVLNSDDPDTAAKLLLKGYATRVSA